MVSPDHYYTLTEVRLWQNDTGWRGWFTSRRKPSGSVRGWPGRSVLFVGPLLKAHLLTTSRWLVVVLPTAAVRPPGAAPLVQFFPAQYIPADANGGLCIGRSYADALGAWGPSATNKLRRVYTGALLATTISIQKQGLNITSIGAILCS